MNNNSNLSCIDPYWLTGFVEGAGCFSISFNLKNRLSCGIQVRPSFSISQKNDIKGINALCIKNIQSYFRCGFVRFSKNDNIWKYECRNIADLKRTIIPHFQTYKLSTEKLADFDIFVEVVNKVLSKSHLNRQSLIVIINKSYKINCGKRKLTLSQLLSKIT